MQQLKHNDCRNFVTVDVAKGICRRTGELIAVDGETCQSFQAIAKCKHCSHYAIQDAEFGTCEAAAEKPWTYPELIAVTCEMFAGKK